MRTPLLASIYETMDTVVHPYPLPRHETNLYLLTSTPEDSFKRWLGCSVLHTDDRIVLWLTHEYIPPLKG